MSSNTLLEQLPGDPAMHGLFDNVHSLRHGHTKLVLDGFKFDPARKLPVYLFNLQTDDGAFVGQYQFTPGTLDIVGHIGNAGGYVDPAYQNRGHSKDAIKALGTLAKRHGMQSFIITCCRDNDAARSALQQVGKEMTTQHDELCFFEIPTQ
jgi:RimJ/RimL family protein N-acetyltransferase